jgi:hypothetical protein
VTFIGETRRSRIRSADERQAYCIPSMESGHSVAAILPDRDKFNW